MTDIMQRMNELSVKAANGTLQVDDREAIQSEINALTEELRRIQDTTSFNEIYLFKGSRPIEMDADDYTNVPFDESTTINGKAVKYSKTMDFGNIKSKEDLDKLDGKEFTVTCSQNCDQTFTFKFSSTEASGATVSKSANNNDCLEVTVNLNDVTDGTSIASKIYDLARNSGAFAPGRFPVNIGHANALEALGSKLIFFANDNNSGNGKIKAGQFDEADMGLPIQAGSEAGNIIVIQLHKIGPGTLGVSNVDVTSEDDAQAAIGKVKGGILKLNEYRSYYGAVQNRLEHTIKNLDNIVENTTSAESQIRDTDMATEMVKYSNNNILLQAGTSMLAQANQSNQNVLSLLQ